MSASSAGHLTIHNAPPGGPETRIRPQIQDMVTDNIAVIADKARHLQGVIPLWFGEGDLVTPAFIRDAAKRALDDGRTFYVPDMRGTASLTAALSAYQTRMHGRTITRERTTVTPGGMQAVALAMELVLETGTNAVYLTPQWPNIHNAIHVAGAEPRPCPLILRDNRWTLDFGRVAALCDARTRAIVFSSPNNPTGWTASKEDLRALLTLGRERGIWIVADEVYGRLYFNGDIAPSMLQIADPDDLLLCVNSFSKAWAMTGFRLGWLTHPAAVADRLGAMTQYLNSGTAAFIQEAGAVAITEGETFVAGIRDRCRTGVAMAHDRLGAMRRVRLTEPPAGGMYAFFQIEGWPDARAACMHVLERAQVGLAPGELFGDAAAGWLRMCVCRDAGQLSTALDRMEAALG